MFLLQSYLQVSGATYTSLRQTLYKLLIPVQQSYKKRGGWEFRGRKERYEEEKGKIIESMTSAGQILSLFPLRFTSRKSIWVAKKGTTKEEN